jgi:hypothetical protein
VEEPDSFGGEKNIFKERPMYNENNEPEIRIRVSVAEKERDGQRAGPLPWRSGSLAATVALLAIDTSLIALSLTRPEPFRRVLLYYYPGT